MRIPIHLCCCSLIAVAAWAQAPPGGVNGGTGSDPRTIWKQADVLVIGEFSGSVTAAGPPGRLRIAGQLLVHRALAGQVYAGERLALSWEVEPPSTRLTRPGMTIQQAYGLWALKQTEGGPTEPLSMLISGHPLGQALLELPRVVPSGDLAYPPDATTGRKLAMELGAALEAMAAHGAYLTAQRVAREGSGSTGYGMEAARFVSVLRLLHGVDYEEAEPVYQHFSRSQSVHLRAASLVGRLRKGDLAAALELEQEAASMANSAGMAEIAPVLYAAPREEMPPETLHALARTALSETAPPALEQVLPPVLARSGRVEFVPYLAVMLESPNREVRDAAMTCLCDLLRRGVAGRSSIYGTRPQDLERHCPRRSPIPDPDEERLYLSYWKQWWETHREEVQADPSMPRPRVPDRYLLAGFQQDQPANTIPPEMAFRTLIRLITAAQEARQRAISQGRQAPEFLTPFTGQMPRDDERRLAEIAAEVTAALAANEQKQRELAYAAMVQDVRPDPAVIKRLQTESGNIVRNGLSELQRSLSFEGWSVVEKKLREIAASVVKIDLPAPVKPLPAR